MVWYDACVITGYDKNLKCPPIKYAFFAYKDGNVWKTDTEDQAKLYSDLIERIIVNIDEINNFKEIQHKKYKETYTLWYDNFRNEFKDLTDKQFELIFSKSYEDAHSSGYDSVYYKFRNLYEFILETKKYF